MFPLITPEILDSISFFSGTFPLIYRFLTRIGSLILVLTSCLFSRDFIEFESAVFSFFAIKQCVLDIISLCTVIAPVFSFAKFVKKSSHVQITPTISPSPLYIIGPPSLTLRMYLWRDSCFVFTCGFLFSLSLSLSSDNNSTGGIPEMTVIATLDMVPYAL